MSLFRWERLSRRKVLLLKSRMVRLEKIYMCSSVALLIINIYIYVDTDMIVHAIRQLNNISAFGKIMFQTTKIHRYANGDSKYIYVDKTGL